MLDDVIKYLSSLATKPEATLFSHAIGIVGLIAAIVFYFRGKREKRIAYEVRRVFVFQAADDMLKNISISYSGQAYARLAIQRILVWNKGREVVKCEDVAPSLPLCVEIKDGELLSSRILKESDSSCLYSLGSRDNRSILNFDHMNFMDYVLIEFVHTGLAIRFDGKIKGGSPVEKIVNGLHESYFDSQLMANFIMRPKFFKASVIIVLLCVVAWAIYMATIGGGTWYTILAGLVAALIFGLIVFEARTGAPIEF